MEPPRWNIITPSQYEWERRGLDFIRAGLPNHDPYRAWANFEFQTPDGPGYQDRLAKHASFDNVFCRVRQYTVAQAESEGERQRRKGAAAREFQIIQSLNHPNILPVLDYKEHELGPALLFRYLDPHAIRFDHYLATQCHKLTTDQRLKLLRQIADAIRYAHRRRVFHRALSPQSILLMKDEGGRQRAEQERGDGSTVVAEGTSPFDDPSKLYVQVFNWQVGVRDTSTTSGRVTNVEDLVDAQSFVYMSPEAIADQRKVTESSDVFSLGAIACHLFASRPPAGSPSELARILRDNKGLSLSAVVDGVGPKLEEMIQWCTHPDVNTRVGSVEDFLSLLDDVGGRGRGQPRMTRIGRMKKGKTMIKT